LNVVPSSLKLFDAKIETLRLETLFSSALYMFIFQCHVLNFQL